MYDAYIYPFDGGNITITITDLPPGQYDVLPYSWDGNYDVTVGAHDYGVKTSGEYPVSNPPIWTEGLQYARYRNVQVDAGQSLLLTVMPGTHGIATIAGLQLALAAPAAPSCFPAPTNLVSWWRGEGSAIDSWDHNKGELHGASFAPGEVGQAFLFNGVSDYVHIPVAGNLPNATNLNVGLGAGLTLDAWVNPSDVGNGHPVIEWSRPVGGAPYGVHLWIGHPSRPPGYFYANIADTDGNWHVIDSPSSPVQPNVFQHIAVTYDTTTGLARLYLNGAVVTEANLGIFTPQTSYELYFGERPPGDINSRYYAGLIDEIDVFSRALEPAEILAIYNAGSAGKCVVNRPPVANDFRAETLIRQPVTIPDVTFIAASSDPDEDTLTLQSVSATSANGGTVALNAASVTYTPPAGFMGSDSFSYTISDGNGGTASASVQVQVNPSQFAAHMLPSAFVDGGFQLNFAGYPGATYTLQRAESLAGPWIDVGSVTADAGGNGMLLDANPPQGNAFYRAVYH
jgi:hypothetical protein